MAAAELKLEITNWCYNYQLVFLNWGLVFWGLVIGDFQNPKNTNSQFKTTNWSFYHQLMIYTNTRIH